LIGEDVINPFEYFFPPRCALCNELLNVGVPICICEKCAKEIDFYNNFVNTLDLPGNVKTYCDGMVCVGRYSDSLKNSLKRFKFGNKPSYYRAFGKLLALKVQYIYQPVYFDMIVPVPLYKAKQKQRGYNQAELIARQVSNILRLPCKANLLVKATATESQSLLSRTERLSNLEDAFYITGEEMIAGKNILLVDDIVTTGSTVNQCCKALKQAGASTIITGVIATTRDY
jgi:competence protein ComFC